MKVELKESDFLKFKQIVEYGEESSIEVQAAIYSLTDLIFQSLCLNDLEFTGSRKSIYIALRGVVFDYYDEWEEYRNLFEEIAKDIEDIQAEYESETNKDMKKDVGIEWEEKRKEFLNLEKEQKTLIEFEFPQISLKEFELPLTICIKEGF